MQQYPVLNFIVRYGSACAISLALVVLVGFGVIGWLNFGWVGLLVAVFGALVVFVVAKSYAEIVTLITDMLLPH